MKEISLLNHSTRPLKYLSTFFNFQNISFYNVCIADGNGNESLRKILFLEMYVNVLKEKEMACIRYLEQRINVNYYYTRAGIFN